MKLSFKDSPVGTTLLFIGLAFIFAGTGINFYNQMFGNNSSNSNTAEVAEDQTGVEESTDVDLAAVSERLNKDLGVYLAGAITQAESGKDILTDSKKRISLVEFVLETQKKSTVSNTITFVTKDVFTQAYTEVFGSTEQYDVDLNEGYPDKANVDSVLGEGNIGWNSLTTVGLERKLTVESVNPNEDGSKAIVGSFSDSQLGSGVGNGSFSITYANNGISDYIVSIIFTFN